MAKTAKAMGTGLPSRRPPSVGPAPSPVRAASSPDNPQPPPADAAPHSFRRHLPHYEGGGAPLFITFTTRNRWTLSPEARSLVLRHILHDHGKKMRLLCAVVMPDHVHIIYTPWADPSGKRYTKMEVIGAIKSASSHSINKALGRNGPVWQDESFDRVAREQDDTESAIRYICENPVRKGLCSKAEDYAFTWCVRDEGG